jgi:hypothetical protein
MIGPTQAAYCTGMAIRCMSGVYGGTLVKVMAKTETRTLARPSRFA